MMLLLCCNGVFAQDLEVIRNPKSQEDFKSFVFAKYSAFEKQKEGKKLPKLKKDDLVEILSYVPFNENLKFTISCVRQIENMERSVLYDKVYQGLVDAFVSVKNIIQMQDKESGIIVCKGRTNGTFTFSDVIIGKYSGAEPLCFTLKIQIRDGRYKLDLYDINIEEGGLHEMEAPIETFLTPDFYLTSFTSDGLGLMKTKRTSNHYVNVRTQVVLEQLYNLYNVEEDIHSIVLSNQSSDNW